MHFHSKLSIWPALVALNQVLDTQPTGPLRIEIFNGEPSMATVWPMFAAKKATSVEYRSVQVALDLPLRE